MKARPFLPCWTTTIVERVKPERIILVSKAISDVAVTLGAITPSPPRTRPLRYTELTERCRLAQTVYRGVL